MDALLAVRARQLTKCFGEVVALDGVDLDVAPGRIHGVVGPNGAGKATLLGLLLGLALPDSGRLEILGAPAQRALAGPEEVAGVVDGPGLLSSLTARQNLTAPAGLRRTDTRTAGIDVVGVAAGAVGAQGVYAPKDVPGAYLPSSESDG